VSRVAREVAVAPLLAYQRAVSPLLGDRCRFEPSCSRYAVQAIREYGILRGFVLAAWRLGRGHPFSRGGLDPLTAQRLFRPRPHEH
jgi:hypothetical protein